MTKSQGKRATFVFRLDELDRKVKDKRALMEAKNLMEGKFKEWGLPNNGTFEVEVEILRQLIERPDQTADLVKLADQLGAIMKSLQLTTSQIRNIFGTVRRIEMAWPRKAKLNDNKTQQAMRDLLLLKPRLAYQAKREPPVEGLEKVLVPMIDTIDGDRDRFQRFVDFFEAVLAYHTSYGGGA